MTCDDCWYSEIADWKQDKTGKAIPIYWCERHKKMCKEVKECSFFSLVADFDDLNINEVFKD
jgi:hypothetical protein